jgi:hypothetical protein
MYFLFGEIRNQRSEIRDQRSKPKALENLSFFFYLPFLNFISPANIFLIKANLSLKFK